MLPVHGQPGPRARRGEHVLQLAPATSTTAIGNGAKVYLGPAELGAVTSNMGKLPTPEEYLAVYNEKIAHKADADLQVPAVRRNAGVQEVGLMLERLEAARPKA